MAPDLEKAEIRKRVIAARDALPATVRLDLAARITDRLLALPAYRDADCVMAYAGFGTEFDTTVFLADVLARRKALVLPRVERSARRLGLHAVRDPATELAAGVWGIREPRPDRCPAVAPAMVDFLLVPGVAFTARCERLGYGGGYYDRLIPELAAHTVLAAAAFSIQIVRELPVSATDRCVHLVATEEETHARD